MMSFGTRALLLPLRWSRGLSGIGLALVAVGVTAVRL